MGCIKRLALAIARCVVCISSSIKITTTSIVVGVESNKARARYAKVIGNLQYGDIICRNRKGWISSLFVGTRVSHVGLYLGNYKEFNRAVVHADPHEGVVIDELYSFIDADYVEVYRPVHIFTDNDKLRIGILVELFKGTEYDPLFNRNTPRLYCTELVAKLLAGIPSLVFKFEKSIINVVYKPDNFVSNASFELITKD